MSKKYPVVGRSKAVTAWIKNPKGAPKCDAAACDAPARMQLDCEVNWFRGDDVIARACGAHYQDLAGVIAGAEKRENEREALRAAKKCGAA